MTSLHDAISSPALKLAREAISSDDRVLVIGATGWFGQTATAMTHLVGASYQLIASRARDFEIGGGQFRAYIWDEARIREFNPTVIIDAAYITREFIDDFGMEEFIKQNRMLTNRLNRAGFPGDYGLTRVLCRRIN